MSLKNSLEEQLTKIDNLLIINSELDTALRSNKEDTHIILAELGEIFEDLTTANKEIESLKKEIAVIQSQNSRSWIGMLLLAGGNGTGASLIVAGCYNTDPHQIIGGVSTVAISNILWSAGHYWLKWF